MFNIIVETYMHEMVFRLSKILFKFVLKIERTVFLNSLQYTFCSLLVLSCRDLCYSCAIVYFSVLDDLFFFLRHPWILLSSVFYHGCMMIISGILLVLYWRCCIGSLPLMLWWSSTTFLKVLSLRLRQASLLGSFFWSLQLLHE